jgi:mannosylglucosylglycerate synthase
MRPATRWRSPRPGRGSGPPLIEASLRRRPLAVGDFPVAAELAAFGFTWFPAADPAPLLAFLDHPDPAVLEGNAEVARRHFSMDVLTGQLADLLEGAGWEPLLADQS